MRESERVTEGERVRESENREWTDWQSERSNVPATFEHWKERAES